MAKAQDPTLFFSGPQRRQVEALFDAILPGDAGAPAAHDVGAAEFLDRLLAREPSAYYDIQAWRTLYVNGLAALDAASAALYGRPLLDLDAGETEGLLTNLSRGSLIGFPPEVDQQRLFATFRNHCIEGCFADPRWGGNRDGLMWRWFGYLQPAEEFRGTRGDYGKR
jgi:hypothetical protein